MKAISVYEAGQIKVEDRPLPAAPTAGSMRIRVKYAGVGFADVMATRGGYPLAPPRPFSPGYEFFGLVEDAGSSSFSAGARVAGMLPSMGAYREFIDIDPRFAVPVPPGLADEAAALIPLNYLTALAMIERYAALAKGQSFLIHGAAGGVGSAALDLARILGLRAYGTASPAKRGAVESMGGVPLARDAWEGELRSLEPGGVDSAFDAFGLRSFRQSWRSLGPRGSLVCYGISPGIDGGWADFLSGLLYIASRQALGFRRRARICGTPAIVRRDPDWYRSSLARIFEWARDGAIAPALAGIYPWSEASEAHRCLAEGRARGKLLLDFS